MWRSATGQAERRRADAAGERGSALLLVVVLALVACGLVAAALPLALTESAAAAHARDAASWRAGAEGALEAVLGTLELAGSWNDVLSGGVRAPVFSPGELDVAALTAEVEREWAVRLDRGADTPRWILVGVGPSDRWFGATAAGVPGATLAVWAADDGADGDGDPFRDANGRILVHAVALASRGGRAAATALVERAGGLPRPVRRIAWWTT